MKIKTIIYAMFLALVCSCDVHEFPDPKPKEIPFVLHLGYDTEMPLYKVVDYTEGTKSAGEQYDVRYVVNLYEPQEDSREVLQSFVFTKDDVSELDNSLNMVITEGTYRFVVWTDYVLQGAEEDLYYDTGRFEYLSLAGETHHGSDDMRDAFTGSVTAKVSEESTESSVEMKRPMGKFNFVATDAEGYDLDGCTIVFKYNGFMPSAYNAHAFKPTDSSTGASFMSVPRRLDAQEAELGFDYVFVNGNETIVNVYIEVYDLSGKLLTRSRSVDVPLVRSKLTTVKARFLTSNADGGVSISPGYHGDHNIIIGPVE